MFFLKFSQANIFNPKQFYIFCEEIFSYYILALTLKDFTEVEMKFEEKDQELLEKLKVVNGRFENLENISGQGSDANATKIEQLGSEFTAIQNKFEEISNVLENVLERLYEFESQRKNNLIFYGVTEETNEASIKLLGKVRDIVRLQFGIQVNFIFIHVFFHSFIVPFLLTIS